MSVLWLVLGLLGCGGGQVEDTGAMGPPISACLEITPEALAFDPVRVDVDPPGEARLTLRNQCDVELVLEGADLSDPGAPYVVGPIPSRLPPQGSALLRVGFDPRQSMAWPVTLRVWAEDGLAEALLYGEGVAPMLAVEPESRDFRAPWIGCERTQRVVLMSMGNAEVWVDSVQLVAASDEWRLDLNRHNGELPWLLSPGLGVDVTVHYRGLDESPDTAELVLTSNDPNDPEVRIPFTATARSWGRGADRFFQGREASDTLPLSQQPAPETIQIRVDGTATPGGWAYDATTRSVVFETEEVPSGLVEVEYHLMPDCGDLAPPRVGSAPGRAERAGVAFFRLLPP